MCNMSGHVGLRGPSTTLRWLLPELDIDKIRTFVCGKTRDPGMYAVSIGHRCTDLLKLILCMS